MKVTYTYPTNSDYNKNLQYIDEDKTVKIKLRVAPMYIRRLKATKAYIIKATYDLEETNYRKDIKKPELKF